MAEWKADAWHYVLAADVLRLDRQGAWWRAWTDNAVGYEGRGRTPREALAQCVNDLRASDDPDLLALSDEIAAMAHTAEDIR